MAFSKDMEDALQPRLTTLTKTKRNCGGIRAKLINWVGIYTALCMRQCWSRKGEGRQKVNIHTSLALASVRTSMMKSIQSQILEAERRRTMLRLSITPDTPLPSIRGIDVKNQPTTTTRQIKLQSHEREA